MSADDRERWLARAAKWVRTRIINEHDLVNFGTDMAAEALEEAARVALAHAQDCRDAAKPLSGSERGEWLDEAGGADAVARAIRALSAPPSGQQEQPGAGHDPAEVRIPSPAASPQRQQPWVPGRASSPARGDADQAPPAVSPRPQAAEAETRRQGHSALRWSKEKQRMEKFDPNQQAPIKEDLDEPAQIAKEISGRAAMMAAMLRSATMERDQAVAQTRTRYESGLRKALQEAERARREVFASGRAERERGARDALQYVEECIKADLRGLEDVPAPPAAESGDVFEAVAREHDADQECSPRNLAALLRERFNGAWSYTKTMAARPCVTPGKDCGWCDSCEARFSLRARAEAGGTQQ